MTCCSTSCSTLGATPVGVLKSNRSRPGAFSEPAWVADSPRKFRMVWCTRWVAVCDREIARRRDTSISAYPDSPPHLAPDHLGPVHDQARHRLLHVENLELAATDRDQTLVGRWPPPSA